MTSTPAPVHSDVTQRTAPLLPARVRSARWWNAVATAFVWGTSLVIAALWVHGGGVQAVAAWDAGTATTLSRLAGLVAANLLLYQVLLMARVPVFERGFGRDAVVRMHRTVGFWSFWLMAAHVVLVIAGYAGQGHVNPLMQAWWFVWDYPGMLLATAGTVLLVGVVVTSMRRARRRVRYESWHLLHLYAYLGVGLSIPHMLWTGLDLSSPAVTAYWWALWAVAAGAIVTYRVGVPIVRSVRHDVRVIGVEPDGTGGVVVHMRGRGLDRLGARAGQFFVWRFLTGNGWMRGHPFSLAAAPTGDRLVIAARRVGDGTERLTRLRPGTRVLFEGPFGTMTGQRRRHGRIAAFAGGSGLAPLVALLESEPYAPGRAVLVTREGSDAPLIQQRQVDNLIVGRGVLHYRLDGPRTRRGAAWLPAVLDGRTGPDVIRHLLPDPTGWDVYVCGPDTWAAAVRRDLRAAGVPRRDIHDESFRT